MISTPEYRVTYRREGSRKKSYKIFQRPALAKKFIENLTKTSRPDLPPLDLLEFELRWCGAWAPMGPMDEKTSHVKSMIT